MQEAKAYLMEIRRLNGDINSRLEEVSELRRLLTVTGGAINGVKVRGSNGRDRWTEIINKIVELEDTINIELDALVNRVAEARGIIARMPDPRHRLILTERYILRRSWSEVALHAGYEERQGYRLHAAALQSFEHVSECQQRPVI